MVCKINTRSHYKNVKMNKLCALGKRKIWLKAVFKLPDLNPLKKTFVRSFG
jgi:hypothetical protein